MAKRRLITAGCFLALILVSVIPAVVHGYIYPNPSEDTANNMTFILQLCNGTLDSEGFRYWGYAILGYPLYYLSKLIGVEFTLVFTWFHVLLPVFIGATLYFVFSRLIGWIAGLLSMVIPVFVSGATVYYIYQGILFNLINVSILYPLLFYFVIKWIAGRRVYTLLISIVLAFIISTFHSSGMYLPVVGLALVAFYIGYSLVKKKKFDKRFLILGGVLVALGVIGVLLLPYSMEQIQSVLRSVLGQPALNSAEQTSRDIQLGKIFSELVPLDYFVKTFLSVFIFGMFGMALISFKRINENLTTQSKLLILFFSCLALVLMLSAYTKLTSLPFRQQTDFAIVFALLTTSLVGVSVLRKGKILLIYGALILIGLFPQFIPTWFQDNSAIKQADKQAIEYLNELGCETYDCSPTISQRIYDNYTKAYYMSGSAVLVIRNVPIVQGCDPDSPYWDEHGTESTEGYQLDKTFDDGEVIISVFRREE